MKTKTEPGSPGFDKHLESSQAQRFGPLSIYNHQVRCDLLGDDLAHAFNLQVTSSLQFTSPLRVFFVGRDGCTEDSGVSESRRFYHPGYIGRFNFENLTGESKAAYKWIESYATANNLQKFEKSDWEFLVKGCSIDQLDGERKWAKWEQIQTAGEAFELLVSTFSRLRYTGITPGKLDDILRDLNSEEDSPTCWMFNIPGSGRHLSTNTNTNTKPGWIELCYFKLSNCTEAPTAKLKRFDYDDIELFDAYKVLPNEGQDKTFKNEELEKRKQRIKSLYTSFLDPFFLGGPKDNLFKGVALPLYDRWEFNGPQGAFLGWIFIAIEKPDTLEKFIIFLCDQNSDMPREVLRVNLNDFADSLRRYMREQEILEYSSQDGKRVEEYFFERFHHIEGWRACRSPKDRLADDRVYFEYEREKQFLDVRIDAERIFRLSPKADTKLPVELTLESGVPLSEYTRINPYLFRVSHWARDFWEGLLRIHNQQMVGRIRQKGDAYMATSHELKDLVGCISQASDKPWLLKEFQNCLLDIALPATGGMNDDDQQTVHPAILAQTECGKDVESYDWIESLCRLACRIHGISRAAEKGFVPETEEMLADWENRLFSFFVLRDTLRELPIPPKIAHRSFWSIALLCVLRNVLKHLIPGPDTTYDRETDKHKNIKWDSIVNGGCKIRIEYDLQSYLYVSNPGEPPSKGIHDGGGTEAAVSFFLNKISPSLFGVNHFDYEKGQYVFQMPPAKP